MAHVFCFTNVIKWHESLLIYLSYVFLTAAAKEQTPCIIFIDEFDSVGAKRTSSAIHPYANQTVNQLLNEMDG